MALESQELKRNGGCGSAGWPVLCTVPTSRRESSRTCPPPDPTDGPMAPRPISDRPGPLLIIQVPCFNEEATLPGTLSVLPRSVPGFSTVEYLVIDDGSTDRTLEVAQQWGAHHVVRIPHNRGLARAFMTGLERSLELGADVIVNTDGDNQYSAEDIPALTQPILAGEADLVIGSRPISEIQDFSPIKKALQRLGSSVVRAISGAPVDDAPSGFRAMSRSAAMRLHVFSEYTYTLETVIQAGHQGMAVRSVPVSVNPQERPSRLVKSIPGYIRRQTITMVRILATYRPFQFFSLPGTLSFIAGFLIGLRFLIYFVGGNGTGHVQSLILAAFLMGIGVFLIIVGLVADLISVNRKLLEDIDWRLKRIELQEWERPSPPGTTQKPRMFGR